MDGALDAELVRTAGAVTVGGGCGLGMYARGRFRGGDEAPESGDGSILEIPGDVGKHSKRLVAHLLHQEPGS